MSEQAKRSVQARCEDIGLVMRAAFWLYGVYVLILLGLGIWMLAQSADQFSMYVTRTQNGILGQAFFRNTLEVDFTRASLNAAAVSHTKLALSDRFFHWHGLRKCCFAAFCIKCAKFFAASQETKHHLSRKIAVHCGTSAF